MTISININENTNELYQSSLSPRQSEILMMISNGYSNKEIAGALEISPETVKTHLKAIFKRTKIRKRTEAIQLLGWAQVA